MAAPARTSTRRILAPAATRRVGRLKLLTAVLLTAALGVGLLVFGMIVAQADARYERARVDNLLERQVEAGREAVGVDGDGELDVELGQRPELAAGYPQLYVVAFAGEAGADPRVVFTPAAPTWPGVGVLDVARDAGATAAHATTTASAERRSSGDDQRLQLLAAPVLEADGEARAAVVGVANREHGEASHARLVSFMWWSAGAMLLFGIFVAVLLSRGRWWVADRVLLRHEQFLRDTAHELRAPVSRLRAVTEAGLSGAEPPERTLERVAAMVRGTDEVIEDLMTLSRLETGREPLCAEPARLDQLVEGLVEARTDDPPIRLESEASVVVVNRELVRRAVGNLLDNAVHHGRVDDPAADVTVTVGGGRVAVADRGPGVNPQLITHMVDRSWNGRRQAGGGLGLTLAGWVARVHDGELRAANRPDGGAVFTLVLPRAD